MAHLEKKRKKINEGVLTIQYHKNSQCTEVSESDPRQHLHIESENTMMAMAKMLSLNTRIGSVCFYVHAHVPIHVLPVEEIINT